MMREYRWKLKFTSMYDVLRRIIVFMHFKVDSSFKFSQTGCSNYYRMCLDNRYDVFRPMHEMWKGYMMQLLETVGWEYFPSMLILQSCSFLSFVIIIIFFGCVYLSFMCLLSFSIQVYNFFLILQEKSVGSVSSQRRSTWCFHSR